MREAGISEAGAPLAPVYRAEYEQHVAAVRGALGETAFVAAWVEGRAMPLEQVVRYALEAEQV
jgi:hypothetical protein